MSTSRISAASGRQLRDRPETELIAELAVHVPSSITLDKKIYSFFTDEGAALVEEHGWTDLVLCGIATESCVCKTAVDAVERNLTPWIVTDACASHAGRQAHDAGLLVTSRFIGHKQLITTGDLLKQLNSHVTSTRGDGRSTNSACRQNCQRSRRSRRASWVSGRGAVAV